MVVLKRRTSVVGERKGKWDVYESIDSPAGHQGEGGAGNIKERIPFPLFRRRGGDICYLKKRGALQVK